MLRYIQTILTGFIGLEIELQTVLHSSERVQTVSLKRFASFTALQRYVVKTNFRTILTTKYQKKNIVASSDKNLLKKALALIRRTSTWTSVLLVLAILTKNKSRKSIPKQYTYVLYRPLIIGWILLLRFWILAMACN